MEYVWRLLCTVALRSDQLYYWAYWLETIIGLLNGLIISAFNINPFIVTLGTMSVTRGIALIMTGGIPIYGF